MKRGEYSLKQYCLDNGKEWILDAWHYAMNQCNPDDIPYKSNYKKYLHCGNPKHKPQVFVVANLSSDLVKLSKESFCIGCNSIAEYYNEHFPEISIYDVWSDKNEISPYEVTSGSGKMIWVRCLCGHNHPDYQTQVRKLKRGYSCPYCSGRKLCDENSLGSRYPEAIPLWSDLNDKTPFDYTHGSSKQVYLKCENGKHPDYLRKIEDSVHLKFRCPICAVENKQMPCGEDHPNWNPNRSEDERLRGSLEYAQWRTAVFIKDDRTCQCCGSREHINAHHIYGFANHKDKRLDLNNGITLCENCHNSACHGSLHNIYGTHDVSPKTLEDYINTKRRYLGKTPNFSIDEYMSTSNQIGEIA